MADYLQVNLEQQQPPQQRRQLLETVAQAAVLPLESHWSMHVAEGGKMYESFALSPRDVAQPPEVQPTLMHAI